MNEEYNWKSLFAAAGIIIIGIVLCLIGSGIEQPWMINIGCSLIASGVVIWAHDFFVEKKVISPLDEWKLEKVYSTRAEKNAESDPELGKVKYCIDVVAFGLGSFRSKHTNKVKECLRNGVNIRIITMHPDCAYVAIRDKEENKSEGTTSHSIKQLVTWANDLNNKNSKGKITIKGYSSMTIDFYWRVDDVLYIGPYWYGVESQQTITYKFLAGGKGFKQYTDYFESLWEDEKLCQLLTKDVRRKNKRREKLEAII